MTSEKYKEIYESLFGGFESLGSDDSEDDENSFIDNEEADPDYHPDDDLQGFSDGETKESYSEEEEAEWNFEQEDTDDELY